MRKSSLCDYSDAYILVKRRITTTGEGDDAATRQTDERNKGILFKNCAPFINCKSEMNNIEINNAKEIDKVMPMYDLVEYSDNYSKTSGSLCQYYRDEPNGNLTDSESFKSKIKITGNTLNDGNTKDVEVIAPLKSLSNFWRTLEMLLINCEVNLILTWSSTCVITNSTDAGRFAITDTKLYVPVVTLSTQNNSNLLQQLTFGFKRTINWNKYKSDPKTYTQNQYLNNLIDPRFEEENNFFVLSFENENGRTSRFFDQPVKNYKMTHENVTKIATGQEDDYTTGCLLDYHYFKENYKIIAIDLSKQQTLDADPRAI